MPEKLLFSPLLSEKGLTARKLSLRLGMWDSMKLVMILKSGRMAATVLYSTMPSQPPNGWLETMMKGPSLGMYSSSSCKMSADMRNVFMAALVNSLPRNSPNSGYRRLMRFSPIMDMAQEAAREPAGPFSLSAF